MFLKNLLHGYLKRHVKKHLFTSFRILRVQPLTSKLVRQYSVYSEEDKSYILQKINERDLPGKVVGAVHVNKIFDHVAKQQINSLEDLLNINGIGPKVLRKICDGILNSRNGIKQGVNLKRKGETHFILPSIDYKNKGLANVVALHIGLENISWALIETISKNLIEWNLTESFSDNESLFHFLELIERVTPMIPFGDLYLMEDGGYARQRQDLHRNQFTAMLMTSLHVLRGKDGNRPTVALVKPSLKNKLYNGFVGSERVSLQNHVVEIMEERSQTDCIIIPRELKDRYFRLKSSPREDMAQALLLATSFINIILNKRTLT